MILNLSTGDRPKMTQKETYTSHSVSRAKQRKMAAPHNKKSHQPLLDRAQMSIVSRNWSMTLPKGHLGNRQEPQGIVREPVCQVTKRAIFCGHCRQCPLYLQQRPQQPDVIPEWYKDSRVILLDGSEVRGPRKVQT
jgi:hypothetical protein